MGKALVFGSTGMVGKQLVRQLSEDGSYSAITVFNRSAQKPTSPKVTEIVTDYENLRKCKDKLEANVLFCCIGTTIKKAGSQDAFYKVDHDIPVQLAEMAKLQQVENFIMISSMGANENSSNFYLFTKGEAERDVRKSFSGNVYFVRPSLLMGNREEFRLGERIGQFLMKIISPIMIGPLKKYRGIKDSEVAAAMIAIDKESPEQEVFNSGELKNLSAQ